MEIGFPVVLVPLGGVLYALNHAIFLQDGAVSLQALCHFDVVIDVKLVAVLFNLALLLNEMLDLLQALLLTLVGSRFASSGSRQ